MVAIVQLVNHIGSATNYKTVVRINSTQLHYNGIIYVHTHQAIIQLVKVQGSQGALYTNQIVSRRSIMDRYELVHYVCVYNNTYMASLDLMT